MGDALNSRATVNAITENRQLPMVKKMRIFLSGVGGGCKHFQSTETIQMKKTNKIIISHQ